MATPLDTFNNVGPKYLFTAGSPTETNRVIMTLDMATLFQLESTDQIGSEPYVLQQSVRAHTRRQYINDTTTVSVAAHTRVRDEGGIVFNNTYPGNTAYLGVRAPGPPADQKEIQFSYTGSFKDLLVWARAKFAHPDGDLEWYYLRSPWGVPKSLVFVQPAP